MLLIVCSGQALAQPSPGSIAPTPSGTYTLAFDHGKPITLTSLSFGDPGVSAFGTAPDAATQLIVTTQTGVDPLPAIVRTCATGGHFGKVVATFTNLLGHVEYTVELKKVSVVSVLLPGVDTASKRPDDLAWTLSAAEEHFNYQQMKEAGAGLSDANRKRLARAHDRMQALMWQQVKGQQWHAPANVVAAPPRGLYSLAIGDMNTSGVLAIGPLAVEQDAGESGKDKPSFVPIGLTVDAARAADFVGAIKNGKRLATAVLTYYRMTEDGAEAEIRIVLKAVTIKPEAAGEEAGAKSTVTILLDFEGLDVRVSA